jgi:branched-chain amino acid transport system substrate-binding protein
MAVRALRTGAVGVLIAATALTGCTGSMDAKPTDVHIGADLEITGAGAALGAVHRRALELKVEQVNASGLLGNRRLVLRVADNRSDPATALHNIETFTADPGVAALITGGCSECVVGAARTLDDRKVPAVSLAAATEVASPVADRRYLFKLPPNAADSAAALVGELRRGVIRKAAVLHIDDLYGRGGKVATTEELRKANITLTGTAGMRPAATDVAAAVGDVLGEDPDALLVWAPAEQAGLVVAAARKAGFTGRILLDTAAAGDLFLPTAASSGGDTTLVHTQTMVIDTLIATSPAKVARKQWFHDYTSRHGTYAAAASFGADAVNLLADAVAKDGGDREGIRRSLESSQVDGLAGPIRLTPDNHTGLMPQALSALIARGGRWHPAG